MVIVMMTLALIVFLGLVYVAWHRLLAVWWRGEVTAGDRALGAMVLTVGQLCAVGYVLGSFGWWTGVAAGWVNGGLSMVVWYLGFRGEVERSDWLLWDDFKDMALTVRVGLKSVTLTLTPVLAVLAVGILTWFALSQPPMAYDAWGYHTVKAVLLDMTGWIQPWYWDEFKQPEGMWLAPEIFGYPAKYVHGCADYGVYAAEHRFTDFYPANDSLLQAYVLAFTRSIRLAQLVQMPFVGMMVLAVYRLVRRVVGGSVETAGVCGLAVVGLWTVMGQCWQGLSDVMVTGLLWAGYALVMVPMRHNFFKRNDVPMKEGDYVLTLWRYHHAPLILSALACGLAVGTKIGAGYWVSGIFTLCVITTITTRRP